MPHGCTLEDLFAALRESAPAEVDALALRYRCVESGLLSVGLKIHYLASGTEFSSLIRRLGGRLRVLRINVYKLAQASFCLVLPPVGSASAAILLLECIERFTGCGLFGNERVQIQVCSPARLDQRRSALLGIGFYLGSDTLRRYALGDFETTVSRDNRYQRGERLVIHDAGGDFERRFDWWERSRNGIDRIIRRQLPFTSGRTDMLAGSGSRLDIANINLLATLLVHSQHKGYWSKLGQQFEEEMHALLDRHVLAGLTEAPWVCGDVDELGGDERFFDALQELVSYAFQESIRVGEDSRSRSRRSRQTAATSSGGILHEMQSLLQMCRTELARQSHWHDRGGHA